MKSTDIDYETLYSAICNLVIFSMSDIVYL